MAADLDPAARQFDFWLGDWDLAWGDGREGRNSVRLVLDGRIVLEEFDGERGTPLRGMSVSAWDPEESCWRQTWVDNQGTYLDFVGGWDDAAGRMILARQAIVEGEPRAQRMVWRDIRPEGLEWDWQHSEDAGATWQTRWQVRYTRRSGS